MKLKLSSRERRELAGLYFADHDAKFADLLSQKWRKYREHLYRKHVRELVVARVASQNGVALSDVDVNTLPAPTFWERWRVWLWVHWNYPTPDFEGL